MPLKRQLKSGSLKITLRDYVKNTFKILVSFDTFSDILDFFKIYVLVLKMLILFCISSDILLNCFYCL